MSETTTEILSLESARAELATAVAAREALNQRSADAAALVRGEEAKRNAIIHRIAEGDEGASAEIQAADDAIRTARSNAAALEEATTRSNSVAERASRKIIAAQKRQANREFINATKDHIAIMEESEEMRQLLESWFQRMSASEARMYAAMSAAARNSPEELSMLGHKNDRICFVPRQMQTIILQASSVVNYDITARSKSTFCRAILDARQKIGGDV